MLDLFQKRRSIRDYYPKDVEDSKINEIINACMLAPSAKNTKAWKFIIVKDIDRIKKLSQTKEHSLFAKNAKAIIVLCSEEWKYWVEDASIVGAYIYLEATNQGLGTCWIQVRDSQTTEGQPAEEYVRKILDIPKEIRVISFFPIGYPASITPKHITNTEGKVIIETWHRKI